MDIINIFAESIKQQVRHANDKANGGKTLQQGVTNGINIAFALIGIVAVIVIILGGINYATSQGDASKITKGKKMLITGIVGLIIALLAFAIVNFVLRSMGAQ